jgi:hypothetical protein
VPTGSSGATSSSSSSVSESLSTSDWERLLALAQQHPTLLSSPHAQALRPATRELLAFCLQTCPFQPADEVRACVPVCVCLCVDVAVLASRRWITAT